LHRSTLAVSSHLVDEESTSGEIECEQVTAVAEQSETNTFIVSSLADSAVTELYRLKSVDKDPAHWSIIDDHLREVLVSRPIEQNLGDFTASERIGKQQRRYLPPSLFQRGMSNGELVKRQLVAYSPSTGEVFCVPCKLFSCQESSFRNGFSDWKNCHVRVAEHENNADHRTSISMWTTRSSATCRVDSDLQRQRDAEMKYWREVLKRVVETIKF